MSLLKIDGTKIILALLTAMFAMCGWYLREVSKEVRMLRDDIYDLRVEGVLVRQVLEMRAGGDPETVPQPVEPGR